ncbi:MAG: CAP domain-containing protein, partial [Clostridiales bacterium]|nr:CAP domain-containing protein [Clostridiales bacterium]
VCGDSYTVETDAAPGHDYKATKTIEATCVDSGSVTYTCTRCGDEYTEIIPATGVHNYELAASVDATCTDAGTDTFTCSVCGDSYTVETDAAPGHDYKATKTIEATCVDSGSVTYTCTRCGDEYTEIIPATGVHNYELTASVDATCTEDGADIFTCSLCGDSYTEVIAATGVHDYNVTASQDATCTEDGYTTYTCTSCGDSYTDIVSAVGHTESDEWIVTTEATSTSYGTKSIICTVCGAILESKYYALIEDNSQGINIQYHTQAEIISYLEQNSVVSSAVAVTFKTEPSLTAPYSLGEVSDESLETALNLVNAIRYVAGIDSVELVDSAAETAQGGAFINCVNGSLSHYPSQPSDMDDDLYDICYSGASQSNLAAGYSSLTSAILNAWMSDSDSSNIDRVGHRRWILYPDLTGTNFGFVSSSSGYRYYAAMQVIGVSPSKNSGYYGVAWPAQNMPVEYFHDTDAWSISMGNYSNSSGNVNINISDIEVTLTRISDGTTWRFSEEYSDGDFYVNNELYGQSGCIIFRPSDISIENEDQYVVTITGIPEEISDETVSYQVNFFSVEN